MSGASAYVGKLCIRQLEISAMALCWKHDRSERLGWLHQWVWSYGSALSH